MKDDTQIPVLQDIVHKGPAKKARLKKKVQSFDENADFEIEADEFDLEYQKIADSVADDNDDGPPQDTSIKELLIDEEIRMILDKHMDNAYAEIIRLLNHKIS